MTLKIDHKSPIPLHFQVESALREMINSPEYPSGTFIPNEVNLATQLGISRHTVRHAISKLVNEGLLERKKGVGTRIGEKSISTGLRNWMSFTQEMNAQGREVKTFNIHVEKVMADEDIARNLEIKEGDELIKLIRIKGDEDGPFVLFESYLHPRIGLKGDEDFTHSLYELLEKDFSIIVDLSREEIKAINADQFVAERLQTEVNSPILERIRRVYDPGMRPVEFCRAYYRADRFSYSIDIKREY